MKLHIKNMVCQRCILAVETTFKQLSIPYSSVLLGEVNIADHALTTSSADYSKLQQALHQLGFEILDTKQGKIIETIKRTCLQYIVQSQNEKTKLSNAISNTLHLDYSHLSQMFSAVEGQTIEQFFIAQRIEKVKELLVYDEKSLSEIAFELGFSSVAHLSGQFKKITGMTPSYFRSLKSPQHRRPLDKL